MKTTSQHLETARLELARHIEACELSMAEGQKLSVLIARFTAQAVRDDRIHRKTGNDLARLFDVILNGRPA